MSIVKLKSQIIFSYFFVIKYKWRFVFNKIFSIIRIVCLIDPYKGIFYVIQKQPLKLFLFIIFLTHQVKDFLSIEKLAYFLNKPPIRMKITQLKFYRHFCVFLIKAISY